MKTKESDHTHAAGATDRPRAIAKGALSIFDPPVPCHVLADGRRVLGARGVQRALAGVTENGHFGRFLARISSENSPVEVGPISFVAQGGVHLGITAEDFQRLLSAVVDLAFKGPVHAARQHIVANARRMEKALVGVGLVALIDEATGYQKERPDNALAQLFKQYLLDECGKWSLEFREPFYTHLARVYRHAYTPGQSTRPAFFRGFTWRYVYGVLPPEVRAELQVRNPNPHEGTVRHHQHLTPAAKAIVRGHILRLTTVLRQSRDAFDFKRRFDLEFHGTAFQEEFSFAGDA